MRLLSVNLGNVDATTAESGEERYSKTPQTRPVLVTERGLRGDDFTAREKDHVGSEQSVYLVSKADLDWWSEEVGRPLAPGALAENLTYEGPATSEIAIGDRFQIGDVLLEVTSPRTACATFDAVMGKGASKTLRVSGHSGVFARVLRRGFVSAGDRGRLIPFQRPRIPVTALYALVGGKLPAGVTRKELLSTPLHAELRRMLTERDTPLPKAWNWP